MEDLIQTLISLILLAAIVLAFVRIWRGPSVADRIVAFDLTAALVMAQLAVWAWAFENPFLIEIAFAIALVGFIATVALARYLEARKR